MTDSSKSPAVKEPPQTILLWLAIGAFAVTTEGLMIAGLLPVIAADLKISVGMAGHLVTVFALAYVIGSPLAMAAVAEFDRRWLLVGSMCVFIIANLLAFFASNYFQVLGARILMALAIGIHMPVAYSIATAVADEQGRARRMAIVTLGLTIGMLFGVPFATLVGHQFGWRSPFLLVALLGGVALLGTIKITMPAETFPVSPLRQRFLVMKRPAIASRILLSALWSMSGYSIYIYIGPYLDAAVSLSGRISNALSDGGALANIAPCLRVLAETRGFDLGVFLLVFGIAGVFGSWLGGRRVRWIHADGVLVSLACLAVAYAVLAISPRLLPPAIATWPVLAAMFLWGTAGWAFQPVQVARLSKLATTDVTVVLSVNQSAVYAGIFLAGLTTPLVIGFGSIIDVAWVAVACALTALVLLKYSRRMSAAVIDEPAVE